MREATELLPRVVDLRRRLHRQPELGLQVPETQQAVCEALADLPLDLWRGKRTTSLVATLSGARPSSRAIVLRAEMDALPIQEDTGLAFSSQRDGVMHACGHDAHVAMLVGAAHLLCRRRAELEGTVHFVFQPGEETLDGARTMIEEGLLELDPPGTAAFALHSSPGFRSGRLATRTGTLLASADTIAITVHGQGGHAAAPHLFGDPVVAACELVLSLQALVTRGFDPFDPVVVTISRIEAAAADNVMPATVNLRGTVRAVSEAGREAALAGIRRVAEGVAAAHGLAATVDVEPGCPPTRNDAEFTSSVVELATTMFGDDHVHRADVPGMSAEDFAYVLERIPGAMVFLGTRPPGDAPTAFNHSSRMVIDESAMTTGIALHSGVAMSYLSGEGPEV